MHCPEDMIPACASIIYCAAKADIAELTEIGQQIAMKWGAKFAQPHLNNDSGKVPAKIVKLLSVTPPPKKDVIAVMQEVAKLYQIDWQPSEEPEPEPEPEPAKPAEEPKAEEQKPQVQQQPAESKRSQQPAQVEAVSEVKSAVDPSAAATLSSDIFPGTLNVIIHKAADLFAGVKGKQNPFVRLQIRGGSTILNSTVDQNGGMSPTWSQEHFPFAIKDREAVLQVEVYNQPEKGKEAVLGSALLNVVDLIMRPGPDWHPLYRDAQRKAGAGSLLLSTQYMSMPIMQQQGGGPGEVVPAELGQGAAAETHDEPGAVPESKDKDSKDPPSAGSGSGSGSDSKQKQAEQPKAATPAPKQQFNSQPLQMGAPISNSSPEDDELAARLRALQGD